MSQKRMITIREADCGLTVEQYLRRKEGFSRAQIRSMKFRQNGICVNQIRSRTTTRLQTGDTLELLLEDAKKTSQHLLSGVCPLSILYEDEDLIALDKPAGMVVHPAHGHYADTLSNHLAAYLRRHHEEVRIHSIGRLDKDTSGIVLFAKNRIAAARLSEQRERGVLRKQYLALCKWQTEADAKQPSAFGRIDIDAPIAPLPDDLMKMRVHPDGKKAVTHAVLERQYGNTALVRLWLETGRTHQIRVHMASIGHPLLGDPLYGDEKTARLSGMARAALHAEKLDLIQPFTHVPISIHAPLPQDMRFCLPAATTSERISTLCTTSLSTLPPVPADADASGKS